MEFYRDKTLEIMQEKNISKYKLALIAGFSHAAVTLWFKGKRTPSYKSISKIARALSVSMSDISDSKDVEFENIDISGYFQDWTTIVNKSDTELSDQCLNAIEQIKNVQKEQFKLRLVIKAVMSAMQAVLYIKNLKGEYIITNESYKEALGINLNIIGKKDDDILSKKVAYRNNTEDMNIVNTGNFIINKICRFPYPNNKIKWCVMTKIPLRDNAGNIVGMAASFLDITKEKKLADMNETLYNTINLANVGIVVLKRVLNNLKKFSIEYVNNAICNMFGFTVEEFLKTPKCWLQYVSEKDRKNVEKYLDEPFGERKISFSYNHPKVGEKNFTIFSSSTADATLRHNIIFDNMIE